MIFGSESDVHFQRRRRLNFLPRDFTPGRISGTMLTKTEKKKIIKELKN